MAVTVFGVRHHGPGSARSLERALEELRPDCVLVEGPPEGDPLLALAADPGMRPPVALLVHVVEDPARATFYPLAEFSPEWRALRHAAEHDLPARLIDLPAANELAADGGAAAIDASGEAAADPDRSEADADPGASEADGLRRDPLAALSEAAGYGDPERWWEDVVEQRPGEIAPFEAIAEAMAAVREAHPTPKDEAVREERREAHMRERVRVAGREGFERMAVVCGAWHAPALTAPATSAADKRTLKGLPKIKVAATWVPWTYDLLARDSGYGAGVDSPAWYEHLYDAAEDPVARWLARAARLLRDEGLDASPAQVVDAVRLAGALAALRGRPLAGLPELTDALRSALCGGSDVPLAVVRERLMVGERMGAVPEATPMVPLQRDLTALQRRLRMKPEAAARTRELDLRTERDRERSALLHRLVLLEVPWGRREEVYGKRGSFHELWTLEWSPALALALVRASRHGTTVEAAAARAVRERAGAATDLEALSALAERALLARLPAVVAEVVAALEARAGAGADVAELMDAVPPLAGVVRYGDVRSSDSAAVERLLDGLVTRVCVGLPLAAGSLDDDAAREMLGRVDAVQRAIALVDRPGQREQWVATLRELLARHGVNDLVSGRGCRLLLDAGELESGDAGSAMARALSPGAEPDAAASWLEGFLSGSGLVLVHDPALLGVLDGWLSGIGEEGFERVVPLLRRTFSEFAAAERRQIGARVRQAPRGEGAARETEDGFDPGRARAAVPLLARILGVELEDG